MTFAASSPLASYSAFEQLGRMKSEPRLASEDLPSGPDLWDRIGPVWRELLDQTSEASAFLSEPWVERWLAHFSDDGSTGAVVWRDGSTAVGCAILPVRKVRVGPFFVRRTLLNASGATGVGCEHNDLLVVDEYRSEVLDDVVRRVRESGSDEIYLVGARRRLLDELFERWPAMWWEGYDSESPFVDLDVVRSIDGGYLMSLSSNTRSKIRRSIRLYEERYGSATTEVADSAEEALRWFREMVDLHQSTWEARGETGAFADPRVRAFYEDLIESTTEERSGFRTDMVRVGFGDRAVGILLNFSYKGRVAFYQSGLAYDEDRRLKPGLVTHAQAIALSAKRGDKEYDFLGGEEESVQYKRSLSSDSRTLVWGQLQVDTWKSDVIRRLRKVRGVVRSLRRD